MRSGTENRAVAWTGSTLLAAWAVLIVFILSKRNLPLWREILSAFQGPFEWGTHFRGHWGAVSWGVVLVSAFWLAWRAAGVRLMRWIGRPGRLDEPESRPLSLLLGFGLYGCASLGLGLSGLLFAPVAAGVLLVPAVSGLWSLRRRDRAEALKLQKRGHSLVKWAAVAAFSLLGLFALAPETWCDALSYHLGAPQEFLKIHKLADVHRLSFRFPLLAENVYGQGMLLGGEPAARLLNLSGAALTAWFLWGWAYRLAGPAAAWLSILALVASDQVAFHMGRVNEGMYSAGFAFLGVWAWTFAARGGMAARWLLVSGAAFGFAMCAKYTAAVPVFGIAAWHLAGSFRRPRTEAAKLGLLVFGGLIASAPFLLKAWFFTANPVYPFVFGGLDWTKVNSTVFREFGCPGYSFHLLNPGAVVSTVFDLLADDQPLFFLSLPFLALLGGSMWAPFACAWAGAILAWSLLVPCVRMTLPAFPAMALASATAVAAAASRGGKLRAIAVGGAAVVLGLGMLRAVSSADFGRRSFPAAAGLESGEAHRLRILTTYEEAVRAVNEAGVSAGRVMLVGETRGYGIEARLLCTDIQDTPDMLLFVRRSRSHGELAKRFKQAGVRYVLLNHVTSEYSGVFREPVMRWSIDELRTARDYWRRQAGPVWRSAESDLVNGGYVLYRLSETSAAPASRMLFLPGAEGAVARMPGESWLALAGRIGNLAELVPGILFFELRLGMALVQSGRAREGLNYFTPESKAVCPEPSVYYGLRGLALMRIGNYAEALELFREARRINPGSPEYSGFISICERSIRKGARR